MSYKQAMKWQRKHIKGTKQPVLMHTNSGFWPSQGFLEDYWEYTAACEASKVAPLGCKEYYDATLRGGSMSSMGMEDRVELTRSLVA
jgi:hypothetical protein